MSEITARALAVAAAYSLVLCLGASLLSACTPTKYVYSSTVTKPEKYN